MKFAGRFLAVGAVVTAVDIVGVLWLAQVTDWPVFIIDAMVICLATILSYWAHRLFSYADNPARRWYSNLRQYLAAVGLAMFADVAVFSALASDAQRSTEGLLLPKILGLATAFVIRGYLYRRVMFEQVRSDQAALMRPMPPASVRLSLVIPAYEEESEIHRTITRVRNELGHLSNSGGYELVVVDDGSKDNTATAARQAGADVVIELEQNRGKGAAVRAGVLASSGATVAFTDADLSYSPAQVADLMELVEQGWDVVVGSRKHVDTSTLVAAGRLREIGGRVINAFTWAVLLGQYRDTQCGIKAFRRDAARLVFSKSKIDGFAFDVELFHLIERYRLRLVEQPVEVVNSSRSTVNVVRDALRLLRDLVRIRRFGRAGEYEANTAELAELQ